MAKKEFERVSENGVLYEVRGGKKNGKVVPDFKVPVAETFEEAATLAENGVLTEKQFCQDSFNARVIRLRAESARGLSGKMTMTVWNRIYNTLTNAELQTVAEQDDKAAALNALINRKFADENEASEDE